MISAERFRARSSLPVETAHRCLACGALHYPARTVCRICAGRRFVAQALSGRGIVHAIVVRRSSTSRSQAGWIAAWVELEEGTLVRAQICADDAIVGLPVALVPRRERVGRCIPSAAHAFEAVARSTG
jgi:uncharacterized OB-fold protein